MIKSHPLSHEVEEKLHTMLTTITERGYYLHSSTTITPEEQIGFST
jgi:hypothetical protein